MKLFYSNIRNYGVIASKAIKINTSYLLDRDKV